MAKKHDKYAAMAAVSREDWNAVTDYALDYLSVEQLNKLLCEMGRRNAPEWVRDVVRQNLQHAEIDRMHTQEMQR